MSLFLQLHVDLNIEEGKLVVSDKGGSIVYMSFFWIS